MTLEQAELVEQMINAAWARDRKLLETLAVQLRATVEAQVKARQADVH
jgi:hypothetical protein